MLRRAVPMFVALALGVTSAACGDSGDDDSVDAAPTTEQPAPDPASDDDPAATSPDSGEGTEADGTRDDGGSGDGDDADGSGSDDGDDTGQESTDLPGEPIDIYPYADAGLAVMGVEVGDTLNVRSGPGTAFDVVTEASPLAEDLVATGHNRTLTDGSMWVEIEVGGETGWINSAYQAQIGDTRDITSELGALSADSLTALGQAVAARRSVEGEGPTPRVVVVAGPSTGDLGEITIDVVGLADDAQAGERLHVFASGSDADGWTLRTVESAALCARGVTGGLCL